MTSVYTETTVSLDKQVPAHWVLFDGECSRCTALAHFFRPVLRRRGFLTAPLQSLWVPSALSMGPRELLQEMRVFTAHGELHSGAAAVIFLARRIWWAWPLWALAQIPGAMPVLRAAYRWIAAHRHCRSSAGTLTCEPDARRKS